MPTVRVSPTSEAPIEILREVRRLLDQAFGRLFSDDDWDHALGGRHVIVTEEDVVVSHAAVVTRVLHVDDRPLQVGYIEAVATAPPRQGAGFGALAMAQIADLLHADYEMGALSTSRHGFYKRLGWDRSAGPTFVRQGSDRLRTEAEDAGVMVLRFGSSSGVNLTAPISCEARPGDDW